MYISIYAFFNSIEIYLLKVTRIALSEYKPGNGAKKRNPFLASKVEFNFWFQFSQVGLMLSKKRQSYFVLEFQRA